MLPYKYCLIIIIIIISIIIINNYQLKAAYKWLFQGTYLIHMYTC
jgi:hypothetical protein